MKPEELELAKIKESQEARKSQEAREEIQLHQRAIDLANQTRKPEENLLNEASKILAFLKTGKVEK